MKNEFERILENIRKQGLADKDNQIKVYQNKILYQQDQM